MVSRHDSLRGLRSANPWDERPLDQTNVVDYWQSPLPLTQLVTTSIAVAVRVHDPPAPVTVKTFEPAPVVVIVVTDSAEVAVVGLGLKVPAAPVGRPLIDSDTDPVNPPVLVMLTV